MTESKYEKYVVRHLIPPDPNVEWGLSELGIPELFFLLRSSGPIKESNTMIEYAWIVKDTAFGVTRDRPPHSHDCDEIFIFLGTDPENKEELGAEVELWMGDGEQTEKLLINTSGLVFIPKGLPHLPIFFKNVKKQLLWMVVGLNVGETLRDTTMYPVRGV